jgi:hypothetical protein
VNRALGAQLGSTLRLALIVGALGAVPLHAQGVVSVRGTVTNEAGRPLEHAQVTLDPQGPTRQVRTDRNGRFSFLGVSSGTHTVRVTWVGFGPESRQIEVAGTNVTVDFMLRRLTFLDTVAVTAVRTGLYGSVISKDSLLPVAGARIEIIGARKADSTTSSGTFNFPDLKAGTYVVRVKHPGFDSRNFGVTVPVGAGTELDVVVERGRVSRDEHMEMLYREMDSRLTFRGANTAFVTREEFKGREKVPLDKALSFMPEFAKRALYLRSDVCVFVDGIARPGAQISDFAPEDIESIELYGAPNANIARSADQAMRRADPSGSLVMRWPKKSPCGMPPMPSEVKGGWAEVRVLFAAIWLRK